MSIYMSNKKNSLFNKKISHLKKNDYIPSIIIDAGAFKGRWTEKMLKIYPDSKYYLFEAINYQELSKYDNDPNVTVKNVILNDKIETVDWYEERNSGDSFYREKTKYFQNTKPTKKTTIDLDTLIDKDNIIKDDNNIFVKIDCQGAEIPILKGAEKILNRTDFIILEMPLFGQYNEGVPSFLEHIQFMESINFIPFDVVDKHYINNYNMQIDMMFINKSHRFNKIVQEKLLI